MEPIVANYAGLHFEAETHKDGNCELHTRFIPLRWLHLSVKLPKLTANWTVCLKILKTSLAFRKGSIDDVTKGQ